LYQIERQYDAPVKIMNIKDIITNYNLPNQDELIQRYDELVRREDEKTADIITDLTAAAAQFQIDEQMLKQAIMELLAGKETPTVDQIMQMLAEAQAQQEQQAQAQQEEQQQMMMQNQENAAMANEAMNVPVTGNEVFETAQEGGPTLGNPMGSMDQPTGDEVFETGQA